MEINNRNIGAESFNGNIENYATSEQQKKLLDAVKLMEDITAGEEDPFYWITLRRAYVSANIKERDDWMTRVLHFGAPEE
jgi:hypothetical protein